VHKIEIFRQLKKLRFAQDNFGVMSWLVELLSLSKLFEPGLDHFPSWLCRPGVISKDPTVWLD